MFKIIQTNIRILRNTKAYITRKHKEYEKTHQFHATSGLKKKEQARTSIIERVFRVIPLKTLRKSTIFIGDNTITPFSGYFSISSEISIDFGLTLFTVLTIPADTGRNEVLRLSQKAYNLITERRKRRQSDKP
ncbi:hypothetical protein DWW90_01180 [Parabacteroides sp. AF17-28]|nr:hypothetical protein DWW90_01180 [Parabacteroides sp. AF17-28]